MESTENKQQQREASKDLLQSCLANLFQAPTKGIEDAFSLILDLVQSQNESNLQTLNKLEQRNDDLVQELKGCKKSNEVLKTNLEHQINDLKHSITLLKDERDDLLNHKEEMNAKQRTLEKRIQEMNEEVKVRLS